MDHPSLKVLMVRIWDGFCKQHVSHPFVSTLLLVPHPTLPVKAAWIYHMASLHMPGQASSPVKPALDKQPAQQAWVGFPCPARVVHPLASHVLLSFWFLWSWPFQGRSLDLILWMSWCVRPLWKDGPDCSSWPKKSKITHLTGTGFLTGKGRSWSAHLCICGGRAFLN